jgi:stabilization protein
MTTGSRYFPCVGASYQLADRKAASQRAVNLWVQQIEGEGEDVRSILRSAPGIVQSFDLVTTIRGMYATDTRWFVVASDTLYELTSGTAVVRGTLATSSGSVRMANGRTQLVVVDGPNGYVLTLATNAFAQITDPDWRTSNDVDELDGYFIFAEEGTDQFYVSALDNATSFDALDFSSADAVYDDIITFRVNKRELYLFGTRSIEIWIDSGSPDFPFARYNGVPIDVGIVGLRAVVRAADTLFWIGKTDRGTGTVYMMQGHQPARISNWAVEEALAGSSDISAATMWVYQRQGAEFIGVNAPGMETTWVYDAATQQWHERAEWDGSAYSQLRIGDVVHWRGSHYGASGRYIYEIDDDTYTIDGGRLMRERTWPHMRTPTLEPRAYSGVELLCTTGNGGRITLELSNDSGNAYGDPLRRDLGSSAMQRVRWGPLGSSRDRVFRLRCDDAVPLSLLAATVDT